MPEKQELVCDGCRKTLRIPQKFWGKKVRCPQCSHVLSVPAAPPAPDEMVLEDVEFIDDEDPFVDDSPYADADPFADLSTAPVAAPPRRPKPKPKPKKIRKRRKETSRRGGSFEGGMLNSGVLGGLGLIAVAVVWFVVGLFFGIIFIYPPFMAIFGMCAIVKGLISGN